ncbi:MAG: hypothetical protein ABEI97_04960 [Candidatus Nanohaloarchaea archaeon]
MGRLSRDEQKIAVLAKLARGRNIGMDYIPVEKVLGRIPSHARGDIQSVLDEMYRERLIEYHKGKDCISLNGEQLGRVVDMIGDEVPDYIIDRLDD